MTRVRLLISASVILTVVLVGCSKNPQAPAKISGSLSYKGQPIKAGTMKFHTAEGVGYDAQISDDGTYSATDIPEGELVVTVETESLNPAKKGAPPSKDMEKRLKTQQQPPPTGEGPPPDPAKYYIKIPDKYSNAKTSPVTVVVKRGRQIHNIDLE